MTTQKCHIPGQVVFITRGCTQRQFLLNNDRDGYIKRAVAYVVALVAIRTHQVIHGLCLMSNHYHAVQMDRTADRSEFMGQLHNFMTKIVNKFRDRRESIWSSDDPSDIHLVDTQMVIEKLLYTWLNPVKAGLVERVEDWDNFTVLPKHWGKTMTMERPDYFNGESDTPETIRFTPMPPPGFEHMSLPEVVALFEGWIREEEDKIKAERRRPVIGMKRCYEISPWSTPKTSRAMYTRNPRFSGSCTKKLSQIITWYKHFQIKYRTALRLFIAKKEAIFPPGTLKMCTLFGCESESPLPSHPNYPRYARYG